MRITTTVGVLRRNLVDLVALKGGLIITERDVQVRFHRRAHLPIVIASGLLDQPLAVPWWDGRPLNMSA